MYAGISQMLQWPQDRDLVVLFSLVSYLFSCGKKNIFNCGSSIDLFIICLSGQWGQHSQTLLSLTILTHYFMIITSLYSWTGQQRVILACPGRSCISCWPQDQPGWNTTQVNPEDMLNRCPNHLSSLFFNHTGIFLNVQLLLQENTFILYSAVLLLPFLTEHDI